MKKILSVIFFLITYYLMLNAATVAWASGS